jgi:hypothetical protein
MVGIALAVAIGFLARSETAHPRQRFAPHVRRQTAPTDAQLAATMADPQPSPQVTRTQALQILDAALELRERARARADVALLSTAVDGAELQTEEAYRRACVGECSPSTQRSYTNRKVFVPPNGPYPASFAAVVSTTTYTTYRPSEELLIFTRRTASAPWHITFVAGWVGSFAIDPPSPNPTAPDPAPQSPVAPDVLPRSLADYWQAWHDHSGPPSTGNPLTSFPALVDQGKQLIDPAQHPNVEQARFWADPVHDGLFQFAASDGRVVICGNVHESLVETPRPGTPPLLQSPSQQEFGALLPPGRYSSVTTERLQSTCFIVWPARQGVAPTAFAYFSRFFDLSRRGILT